MSTLVDHIMELQPGHLWLQHEKYSLRQIHMALAKPTSTAEPVTCGAMHVRAHAEVPTNKV
jgi:hypothetical protein